MKKKLNALVVQFKSLVKSILLYVIKETLVEILVKLILEGFKQLF